jgi:hypothetical protein
MIDIEKQVLTDFTIDIHNLFESHPCAPSFLQERRFHCAKYLEGIPLT